MNRAPHALGSQRHLQRVRALADTGATAARQRIDYRIDYRRRGADRSELADTFDAHCIVQARGRLVHRHLEVLDHCRVWQRVVEKARGQGLSGFAVIDEPLAQRLSDALRRAALELADDDHGIDDAAHVVDRPVAGQLNRARLRIDFDFADVAAVGPGGTGDGARRVEHNALLRLPAGDLEQANAPIGTGDAEHAVAVFDVTGRRFHFIRRHGFGFSDGAIGSDAYRGSADKERA